MLTLIIGFFVGTCLGSLSLCLADRATSSKTFFGRSHCDKCQHQLSPLELVPIISYFVLRGKCRHCRASLSIWYPISEILMGLIIAFVFWQNLPSGFIFNNWIEAFFVYSNVGFEVFVVTVLSIVLVTDIKTGLIPDRITYPAFIITFLSLFFLSGAKIFFLYFSLKSSALGQYLLPPHSEYFTRHAWMIAEPLTFGIAASLVLGFFFGALILITRGRGMGGGDLKLAILIGLILGLPLAIVGVMLAFILGSLFGIGLILFRKKKFGQTIPFGPFLSLGALIAFFWGQLIMNWYIGLA